MELAGTAPLLVGAACVLLTILGVTVVALKKSYVQSSVVYIIWGIGAGAILRSMYGSRSQEELTQYLSFSDSFYFNVLLPFVVLDAGLNMKRESVDFTENFVAITLFTVMGTLLSGVVIGFAVWGTGRIAEDSFGHTFNVSGTIKFDDPFDSLKFGGLISPTDPVAILSVLGALLPLKDPYLYSVIFGESVLNDAVGIIMFETFDDFSAAPGSTGVKLLKATGQFCIVSVGSVALGIAIGLLGALVSRCWIVEDCHFEVSLIFFACYFAYLMGDYVGLSGIISLFTASVMTTHYTFYNVRPETLATTNVGFRTVAWLSEAAIFFYLGIEVVLAEVDQWEFSLIAVVTLITFVGRGLTVLVLTAGYNCAAPVHKKTSLRSQAVMTAAGLRGGTAYALAMKWDGNAGRIGPVETLTMGIIIISLCGVGSVVGLFINSLGLSMDENERAAHLLTQEKAVSKPKDTGWLSRFDRTYFKRFLRRSGVNESYGFENSGRMRRSSSSYGSGSERMRRSSAQYV